MIVRKCFIWVCAGKSIGFVIQRGYYKQYRLTEGLADCKQKFTSYNYNDKLKYQYQSGNHDIVLIRL